MRDEKGRFIPAEQVQQRWVVEEVYGTWWAYFGPPRPDNKYFVTHTTRPNTIIGPFHNKQFAEEQVAKHKAKP